MLKDKLEILLEEQKKNWDVARKNYEGLKSVERKEFNIDGTIIRVEHNAARAVSSLAKTDAKTIAARKCFLCENNRPKEQAYIDFLGKYQALVNPFPIFPKHFTIAAKQHCDQGMSEERLGDMLTLAAEMEGYAVFYNGPRAGASAPDHFHLQAGNFDYFPQPEFTPCDGLIRREIITGNDENDIVKQAQAIISNLASRQNETEAANGEEPMMNIFCRHEEKWTMTIMGRKKHRPECFHKEEGLKISPGAVDMAGVIIAARKEDFDRISANDIRNIYSEVSLI